MSSSEQSTREDLGSTPHPAFPGTVCVQPGSVHLLMADSALPEFHRGRAYFTLCGVVLPMDELPPWECPEGCVCAWDTLICPDCVRRDVDLQGAG